MSEDKIEEGKQIIKELARVLAQLSDAEAGELLFGGTDDLLKAMCDPTKIEEYPSVGEFFLAYKHRLTFLAKLRHVITMNYSFSSTNNEGKPGFASPFFNQFFEDGVMLLVSQERFSGYILLYQNGEEKIAIVARDVLAGQDMSPEDFEFIPTSEFSERFKSIPPEQISDLERPIIELTELLDKRETDESKYQDFIERYPWILGAQYSQVLPHIKLNDANVPDFLAMRVHDRYRDILEIKQPFINIFRADGTFHSEFNDACNQVERYIDFVRENKDYLYREKGLRFDKPKCYLLVGYQIDEDGMKKIRIKGRNNPAI